MGISNEETTLNIPSNIKTRTEFIEGYGVKELIQTIIVGAIISLISYAIYMVKNNMLVSVLIALRWYRRHSFSNYKKHK